MKYLNFGLIIALSAGILCADVLRLRDGNRIQGTLLGANAREVQFMPQGGSPRNFPITSVAGIDFEMTPPPAPPSAPSAAGLVIPAGTVMTVRLIDGIDSKKTAASERFRASVDDPVVVGNQVAIPRNAVCTVQVVTVQGSKEIAIKLYDVTLNGRAYDVVAGYAVLKGQGASKKRKGFRRGAALGGIGAGIGAISGAAAKGKTLKLPPETRLSFELRSPLPLG